MKVRTSVRKGIAFVAIGALTFAACDDKSAPITVLPVEVTVVPSSATLTAGQTLPVGVTVANAANPAVTWSTSNAAVATVSTAGVITAVIPGTALITATSVQDPNAKGFVSVTVTAAPLPVVTMTPATGAVQTGQTIQLVVSVTGTTNTAFTCTSAATSIATVVQNSTGCLVSGVAAGTAVITARSVANTAAAASSTITVSTTPVVTPVVTITPAQATTVAGSTVQFVVNVTNATNTAFTCSSAAPAVATVVQNATGCLATAVAAGTAVITATSAANNTAVGVATLTVNPPPPQPSVSINSVLPAAGGALNPAAVTGNIIVTVNVSAVPEADIRRVQVRIDGTQVCEQTFSQPLGTTQGVAEITCTINTAALNAAGAPVFPNGVHTLSAVAINGAGAVITEAVFQPLTFANPDAVTATVTFDNAPDPNSAIGSNGLAWNGGSVTVSVVPALFSGATLGTLVIGIDVDCDGTLESTRTATATAGVWSVTFPESGANSAPGAGGGVAGITDDVVCARITAATSTGGQNIAVLGVVGGNFSLDNVAPAAPTVALQNVAAAPNTWVNASYLFNAANVVTAPAVDVVPGVGNITYTFHVIANTAANAALTDAQIVAQGMAVTSGADLADTNTSTDYIMVVRAKDALGNFVDVRVADPFGVDKTVPTAAFVAATSPANMRIYRTGVTGTFSFTLSDVQGAAGLPSGFDAFPLYLTVTRWTSNPNTVRCIDPNTGVDTAVPAGGTCAPVNLTTGNTYTLPTTDGYYEVMAVARDRAGNPSATLTRLVLVDDDAPVVTITSFGVAGSQVSVNATITDNVDLRGWDQRIEFAGATAPTSAVSANLPITGLTGISTFGFANRVGSHDVSANITIWRSLTGTDGAGAPTTTWNATGAGVGAFDIAKNFGEGYVGSAQAGGGPQADLTNFTIALSGATACNGLAVTGDDTGTACSAPTPQPSTRTVTLSAVGPTSTFLQPFTTVFVYGVDPNGNVWLLGTATAGPAVESGGPPSTTRTFPFTFTFTATGLTGGTWQVFAVGYNATTRDAIRSQTAAIVVSGARNQP